MTTESSKKYVCLTTNQPDFKSNPNLADKQHALVSIQRNIVTCPIRVQRNS